MIRHRQLTRQSSRSASRDSSVSVRPIGVAVRQMVESLETRALLAAVSWTGNGDGTNWINPNNWSSHLVPTSSDDVTINIAANPTIIVTGDQAARSLNSAEAMDFQGGSITLGQTSQLTAPVSLNASLGGAGNVTFTSTLTWNSGDMAGSGTTTIASGATLNLINSSHGIRRTLVNAGTTNFTGGSLLFTNGNFQNNGTFVADAGPNTIYSYGGSAGGGEINRFKNAGTFFKRGSGTTQFFLSSSGVPFDNSGTVNIEAGRLDLGSGGVQTGDFNVSPAATLALGGGVGASVDAGHQFAASSHLNGSGGTFEFSSGSTDYPGAISNAATLFFNGGTATLGGNVSVDRLNINSGTANFNGATVVAANGGTLSGGQLGGSANVTYNGTLDWTAGTMAGSGTTYIPALAHLEASSSTHALNRTLIVTGSTHWTAGQFYLTNGTFQNDGAFTAESDDALTVYGGYDPIPPVNLFINNGSITKRGLGAMNFVTSSSSVPFNNAGTVAINEGSLQLDNGGAHTGDFTLAAGTVLQLGGSGGNGSAAGNVFAVGSDITGPGEVRITTGVNTYSDTLTVATLRLSNGSMSFDGAVSAGLFDLSGGSVFLNAASTFTQGTFNGGTLAGSGNVTFTQRLIWSSGVMSGTGQTLIPAAAELRLNYSTHELDRQLTSAGTTNWRDGVIYMTNGTFVNNGTFNATSDNALSAYGGYDPNSTPANRFINNGTFVKTGIGHADFTQSNSTVPFDNNGTLTINQGDLSIRSGGASAGSFAINNATSALELGGPNLLVTSSSITGVGILRLISNASIGDDDLNGPINVGQLEVSGSTHRLDGVTTAANGILSGGILTGDALVTFTSQFVWTSGTLAGAGTTRIAAGAQMRLASSTHSIQRVLENLGTATWTGGVLEFTNGTLRNVGTFSADSDTALSAYGGYDATQTPVNVFINTGTFDKLGTARVDFFTSNSSVSFNNSGVVHVKEGVFAPRNGGTSGGTFDISSGAVLELAGGHTLASTASVSGAGTLRFSSGSPVDTNVLAGSVVVGRLEVVSGINRLNAPSTATFTTGQLDGGTIGGSSNFTFSTSLFWTAATMDGTGVTTIPTGATLDFRNSTATLARTLINNGAATWRSGAIQFVNGTLVNNGSFVADSANTLSAYGGYDPVTPVNLFDNNGSFIQRGTGTTQFFVSNSAVPFDNVGGTVSIEHGVLSLTTASAVGTFVGGTWTVNGKLIANGSSVATVDADITVGAAGSLQNFDQVNLLRGRLGFEGGSDYATAPQGGTFVLEGVIDLSPDSLFTVTGNVRLAGIRQPIIRAELASPTSFGKVRITGSLDLNSPDSTSRFDPDLVGGYNPAIGSQHDVIVAGGGVTNAFDAFFGGVTPGGNTLLALRPDVNTVAVGVGNGPAPAAPKILTQTFDYQTRQAVVFQFDQDVSAFLSRKDYTITNLTTGQVLPQTAGTLTFNQASNQATLLLTNQLADGNYKLVVQASDIANSAGVPLTTGSTLQFFVLSGDANHDRKVDFSDLLLLAQHFNQSGQNYATGDFNYSPNGLVDFSDLLILAQHFNKTLPAPPTSLMSDIGGVAGTATATGIRSGDRTKPVAADVLA